MDGKQCGEAIPEWVQIFTGFANRKGNVNDIPSDYSSH